MKKIIWFVICMMLCSNLYAAAANDYYVDPAAGTDDMPGGTIVDPWASIQYALDTGITRDATDGDQINLKAGTSDTASAPIDVEGTYGNPTNTAPLIIRGYTSAADDGGIGVIDGGAAASIMNDVSTDSMVWKDLQLTNTGANVILNIDNNHSFENVEFDNASGDGVLLDVGNSIINCYFHNIGGDGLQTLSSTLVMNCYFVNGDNDFTSAIVMSGGDSSITLFNIINVDAASNGIEFGNEDTVIGNTIYSAAGSGTGILPTDATIHPFLIMNNYVEGFSDGGVGIEVSADDSVRIYGNNVAYGNNDDYDLSGDIHITVGTDDTLSSSNLTNAGGADFSMGTDAKVKADALYTTFKGSSTDNYLDKGAAQREEAGAGGETSSAFAE